MYFKLFIFETLNSTMVDDPIIVRHTVFLKEYNSLQLITER